MPEHVLRAVTALSLLAIFAAAGFAFYWIVTSLSALLRTSELAIVGAY